MSSDKYYNMNSFANKSALWRDTFISDKQSQYKLLQLDGSMALALAIKPSPFTLENRRDVRKL